MPTRRVVIDHLTIGVKDLDASRDFYRRALEPLGFSDFGPGQPGARDASFGVEEADDFIISELYPSTGSAHVAFAAESREQVDAFHTAALAAGGTDDRAPAARHETGSYAAATIDPDGNNIEAVFRTS